MNKFNESRYKNVAVVLILLMLILAIRLFVVTMVKHDKSVEETTDQNTKIIYTPAPRGNIYDRNGVLLAGTKQIFSVNFNASAMDDKEINEASLSLINKLEEFGDEYIDEFPIKKSKAGNYYYTYNADQKEWLEENGFQPKDTAADVLKAKRREYKIDSELSRFEAMDVLLEKYRISLPIVPKTMEFTYKRDLEQFWKKFGFTDKEIEKGIPADKCFKEIRKKCKIDKNLSDEDARKILMVRNSVNDNAFKKYMPITVANDISKETVVYLEEIGIKGATVVSGSKRYYPYDNIACHVIGYMGAISEGEMKEYIDQGNYLPTDLVGKDGIEAAYENKLHGTPGIKKIKVNSQGDYVSTISEEPAKKGSDIYLTIDVNVQKAAQEEMAKSVRESKTGKSAGAVAINPNNGEVIALASYPDYDLNMFADGISSKEWKSVQPENPRNNLSPAPLYNNATRASVAPGSTFKIITSIAGLECGLNPNMYINDRGFVKLGDKTFGCVLWNYYNSTHGTEDLAKAIGTSCNYYFYCVSSNKNWQTGGSMGENNEIGIQKILDTAKRFGLGEKTGIEIGETVNPIPSQKGKIQQYKVGAWNAVYEKSYQYFPEKVLLSDKLLKENIDKIVSYMDENPSYGELCKLIEKETDVKKSQVENVASMVKYDYFNQAKWTTADAFITSIGQGGNTDTPAQVSRYVAAVANGGKLYDLNLVKGIEGDGLTVKKEPKDTGLSPKHRDDVVKGMRYACVGDGGTMVGTYKDYPVEVAGKSGTAENQAVKQPADEVEYIKAHLGELNGRAGSSVTWSQVEDKMKELMVKNPKRYVTKNDTVDTAVIEASGRKINTSMINANKGTYSPFSWIMAFAPLDKPEIAVATMMVEGEHDGATISRSIFDAYFGVNRDSKKEDKDKDEKKTEKKVKEKTYRRTYDMGANRML